MSLVSNFSAQELVTLCEIISTKDIKEYFKKNPRAFSSIKPGFRSNSLTDADIFSLIESNPHHDFIEAYFDSRATALIAKVEDEMPEDDQSDGYCNELAKYLSSTPFKTCPELYFKLTSHEYLPENEKKTIEIMKKKAKASVTKKKTVGAVKVASVEKKQEDDELKSRITELEEIIESLQKELQEKDSQLKRINERISQADDEEAFSKKHSQFEHLSVGIVSLSNYDGKRWINRLGDVDSSSSIQPFESDHSQPRYYANRDRLFLNDNSLPDGLFGVWGWNAKPNDNDPEKDYVTSEYQYNLVPVEIIEIESCESTDQLLSLLKKGIKGEPKSQRFFASYYNYKNDNYIAVLCNSSQMKEVNGTLRLSNEPLSLPVYSFSASNIVSLNDSIQIYDKLVLGPPDSIQNIKSEFEIIKQLVLDSIPWSVFKQRGSTKADWQNFKKYLEALKSDELLSQISSTLNCSNDTAKGHLDAFIENAGQYIDATSFDDAVLSATINGNPELMEKCITLAGKKWEEQNKAVLDSASQELASLQDDTEVATSELNRIKEECRQKEEEAKHYQSLIDNGDQIAASVQEKVTDRINAARKDASDFLAEMAFMYPSNNAAPNVSPSPSETKSLESGTNIEDVSSVIENWEDAVEILSYELEEAGVDSNKARPLALYLYSAYVNNVPIILAGPNGSSIVDALSATLFGRLAGKLTLPEHYEKSIINECIQTDDDIITIINPLSGNWIPHLSELLGMEGKYFCAVYPFIEDIQFEPNSLFNYFMPLNTEYFVDKPALRNFQGGKEADNYQVIEKPDTVDIPNLKDIRNLRSSLLIHNHIETLLMYMHEMGGGDYESASLLTVLLPYAIATQQEETLKEMVSSWTLIKDTKDDLARLWRDFE